MKKVLVVDDEALLRQMMVAALKHSGFETIEAEDGLSAFELAKAHIPSLIISDVMMSSGSGFVLLDFLKREPQTAKIPVILISGKAREAGAWGSDSDVEYLEKPFDLKQLLSTVERMVK